ncbi:uncharacterized protein [Watersipora subatra]|uniref:uncharacterized protein n=1 Tax=Watersipora subatra TaxID=2589382 RepID=UPI00355C5EFA
MDDIIKTTPDFDTHLQQLEEVFQHLKGAKLKPSKCELPQSQMRYIDDAVSAKGVFTDPEKMLLVQEWLIPKGLRELQGFLSMVGYYRQYITNFTATAWPLHRLTDKSEKWTWGKEK